MNRDKIVVDNVFAYEVALDIVKESKDLEPKSIRECRRRKDWPKWKYTIQVELNSLAKREIFGPVVQTPEDVKPVPYKWVFDASEMRKMKL